MTIVKILNKIGDVTNEKGAVNAYRRNPGDATTAAIAALYYAKMWGEDMVLVPGGSYGVKVFHIARTQDRLEKYTAKAGKLSAMVVTLSGEVYQSVVQ